MPRSTSTRLVIVESAAKVKIIAGYLGSGYVVESSLGHVRDLPRGTKDLPEEYKKQPWAYLGVNVDDNFTPVYVISADRKKQITRLKALIKDADELYLATDGDREGEAIAWHLIETLKPKIPVKRMVFNEITKPAILAAVENLRELDKDLVDAQEARRILDRLYGYDVSAVLWKKVQRGLSAGRVQSIATRIVVERERQRMAFHAATYWDILAALVGGKEKGAFTATLNALDGVKTAMGKDFDPATGQVRVGTQVVHLDEQGARGLAARLEGRQFVVDRVEEKPYRRKPYAPFITSTLQQEASRKLRYSSQQTMRVAQRLYENGYITYMRTDSTNLSQTALNAARQQVRELYGDRFVPPQPRLYTKKAKNAQEAHEAIRPAGDAFRTPGDVAKEMPVDELKLYELIWRRTIASQMTDAIGNSTSVRIKATTTSGEVCDFTASGKTITDPGFLKAYVESTDDENEESEDAESRLPILVKGDQLGCDALTPTGHTTQPPSRYTEASLIKAMEELGVGRPSTYTPTIQTIQDREYVFKKGQALIPSFTAFAVIQLLEQYYPRLVDYNFTASMEDELDQIAGGEAASVDFLKGFYFGGEDGPEGSVARSGGLQKMVTENLADIDARAVNSIPLFDDVVVRVGRYGPYLQKGDDAEARAAIPESLAPDELTREKVEELFIGGNGERDLGPHPETGEPILVKTGRYGPYISSGEKSASLFKTQSPETVTFEEAVQLLTLPRVVGKDPEGEEIVATSGRYGPYIKRGTDSRSIETEEQIFTITLEQALAILAQPKMRAARGAAKPPLREMGPDPVTQNPLVIKDGRFGPYVTDGEYNASLRRGDTVEELTIEKASEMLAEKRAAGPAKKKATKKAAAKKADAPTAKKAAAAKKTTAKKAPAAKKTPAKKAAAPEKELTETQKANLAVKAAMAAAKKAAKAAAK
ncbi:type I DNA topoisomerase [Longispora sp. K20-0274]|uniref:type I DNA topoisomerase n=1 Tax=Longispora sp. K20-0274 TaxID=3088255 RepID=UPI00399C244F